MKKIHVNSIRFVGVSGFAIIILVLLTVPNVGSNDIFESVEIIPDSPQDIVNQAISQNSIIDTNVKFTESNDSILQKFLDSQNIDSPLSTEKFGIEIQTALIDSFGNKSLNSTIFGVSQLSVTDEQGRILDLGSIQTSFLGITRNIEKSTNIWGTVKFYLDDQLIDTKKIWASSANQQKTPLSVVSSLSFDSTSDKLPISPPFSDRKTNFTFTLSDEGRNWKDGENHYYRVVLTDVNASIDSDNDFKKFSWSGEYIAYELKVTVEESKVVRFDVTTNQAVSVFKSDGTLSVTSPIRNVFSGSSFPSQSFSTPLPTSFELFVKSTGKSIGIVDNSSFVPSSPSTTYCGGYPIQICVNTVTYAYWKNPSIVNIPRGTDLLIKTGDGQIIEFKTPLTQHNLFISCDIPDTNTVKCTSNFGYSR